MRKSLAPIAITAALAGGAGALAFMPSFAGAQDSGSGAPAETTDDAKRVGPIERALAPLVEDGTLTQAQADKVKEALREALPYPIRHHRGVKISLEAAAEYLEIDTAELHAALRDGKTLAEVAEDEGKDVDGLIDAIVTDANERIDQAVADENLTEEQAATLKANLEERVTRFVNEGGPRFRRHGRGPGGPGYHDGPEAEAEVERAVFAA